MLRQFALTVCLFLISTQALAVFYYTAGNTTSQNNARTKAWLAYQATKPGHDWGIDDSLCADGNGDVPPGIISEWYVGGGSNSFVGCISYTNIVNSGTQACAAGQTASPDNTSCISQCGVWDQTFTTGTGATKAKKSAFTAELLAIFPPGDYRCSPGSTTGCAETDPPNANNYSHCLEGCVHTCFNSGFEAVKIIGTANTSTFTIGQSVTVQGVCTPTGQQCTTNAQGQTVIQINVPESNQMTTATTQSSSGQQPGSGALSTEDKANLATTATKTSSMDSKLQQIFNGMATAANQQTAEANAASRHGVHMGKLDGLKGVLEQIRDKPVGGGSTIDGITAGGDTQSAPSDPTPDRNPQDLKAPGETDQGLASLKNLTWTMPGASNCPVWTFRLWQRDYALNAHCSLVNDNRAVLEAVMTAAWLLVALLIVLSA